MLNFLTATDVWQGACWVLVGCLRVFPQEIVWNTPTAYIESPHGRLHAPSSWQRASTRSVLAEGRLHQGSGTTTPVQEAKASDSLRAVTCPGRSIRYEINLTHNAIAWRWGLANPVAPFNVENSFFPGLPLQHATTLKGASFCEHLRQVNFVPCGSMFHGQVARRMDFALKELI